MTEEELNQYIAEQLGDQRLQALTVSNWRSLRARYRWIGDKLFDIDPQNPCAPCFLAHEPFLLFALDPTLERLRFFQALPESEYDHIFMKLATSGNSFVWDEAYEYFDESYHFGFPTLMRYLQEYRDQLLQIDTSTFPQNRRLITFQQMSNPLIEDLFTQKLRETGYYIENFTKQEIATGISRYRWFGDEVFKIYKNEIRVMFIHNDSRFLAQMMHPSLSPREFPLMAPSNMDFKRLTMTSDEMIQYVTPEANRPWGQIWGYVESRPTSVPDETRNAIKLQFRNQFQISYDMI